MSRTIRSAALAVAAALAIVPAVTPAATAASTAAAKPNLRACYDGRCNLTLTKSVSFRVSPRFGITRLAISFDSSTVHVKGTARGAMSQVFLSEGATGSVNNIGVRVVSLSSGKAVLRLSARR
ncbi:unnamed protein product [[Actinomadura] parvosata subsp. kistnae]|uniref:Uncharacterized protein n=1 Tax=[Actinomadura] parvosata subsp. kistnae TaxID=1909395 RepID=A0A1U9ZRX5_9ACTN|nr:hypothetical protein [Nonomuraea sp. ATCC 55076]AQZ60710.1 hypothetical protein BKM31_03575 [Nonomuraea sp. ATCC 55076]SPL90683.1 unnamed protein product [Actinomadura parvosata subsp. kistnae]